MHKMVCITRKPDTSMQQDNKSNFNNFKDLYMDKFEVEVLGETYHVSEDTACLVYLLLDLRQGLLSINSSIQDISEDLNKLAYGEEDDHI